MTIIDPNNATVTFSLITRYYNVTNNHNLVITNESTGTASTFNNVSKSIVNKYITYVFTLATTEGDSFSYKITDATTTNIMYRGKAFSTAQVTQQYRING